jgi:prolipoprotein diacylglyceryltransferase
MHSEIIGMPTTLPWGEIFERVDPAPRHPAQIYEAFSYILIIAWMMWVYKTRREKLINGFCFGMVLVFICTARFVNKFVGFIKNAPALRQIIYSL